MATLCDPGKLSDMTGATPGNFGGKHEHSAVNYLLVLKSCALYGCTPNESVLLLAGLQ